MAKISNPMDDLNHISDTSLITPIKSSGKSSIPSNGSRVLWVLMRFWMGFWGSLSSLLASFFGSTGWIDQKVVQVRG